MKQLKRIVLISSLLAFSCTTHSKIIKSTPKPIAKVTRPNKKIVVAVIDTGIAEDYADAPFLCKFGHKDFTNTDIFDRHGHGTNVSGLIDQYVKGLVLDAKLMPLKKILNTKANYCQVILKFYDRAQVDGDTMANERDAFQRAIDMRVDVINFSGGGEGFSNEEYLLIKKALDLGIKIIVAAGNESSDLNKRPFYPAAMDRRLYVVGNLSEDSNRNPSSNYGVKVNTWEYGTHRTSYGIDGKVSIMTGTSQATAVKTGKLVREILNSK